MPDFTFVTYDGLPDLDPDDRLAVDALARRGMRADVAVWNDPAVDWSKTGVCVIRSTWDYHLHFDRFMRWASHVDATAKGLHNPLPIIRWNAHKSYVRELAARGAPMVPTVWIARGAEPDLGAIVRERGWTRAVIKPAVGLATRGVIAIDDSAESIARGRVHALDLLAEHDVMVQPFIGSVETTGERALVFIGGAYSHAASKTAFQALAVAGAAGERPVEAEADEIAVATRVIRMAAPDLLYGRVDLVRDDEGDPLVIELELVEPSLFLGMHPDAPDRFARALERYR